MAQQIPEEQSSETRNKKRFRFETPLAASFATLPVQLLDISISGAQVVHSGSLVVSKEGMLSVHITAAPPLVVRARVRWCRLSGRADDGALQYRSGLALVGEESAHAVFALIEHLVRARQVRYDAESLKKKGEALARKTSARLSVKENGVPAATLLKVSEARLYLNSHPEEARKWLSRARFAIRRQASPETLEQLAVWEYLERKIELAVVEKAWKTKS